MIHQILKHLKCYNTPTFTINKNNYNIIYTVKVLTVPNKALQYACTVFDQAVLFPHYNFLRNHYGCHSNDQEIVNSLHLSVYCYTYDVSVTIKV